MKFFTVIAYVDHQAPAYYVEMAARSKPHLCVNKHKRITQNTLVEFQTENEASFFMETLKKILGVRYVVAAYEVFK